MKLTRTHIQAHTHTHAHIQAHTHTNAHIQAHTHRHAHIEAHTHTQILFTFIFYFFLFIHSRKGIRDCISKQSNSECFGLFSYCIRLVMSSIVFELLFLIRGFKMRFKEVGREVTKQICKLINLPGCIGKFFIFYIFCGCLF